jgi:hypothetical protein
LETGFPKFLVSPLLERTAAHIKAQKQNYLPETLAHWDQLDSNRHDIWKSMN